MTHDQVFKIVRKNLLDVLPELNKEDVSIDDKMTELGANSIDRMDVVVASMHDLGIEISSARLAGVANLRSLTDVLFAEVP